LARRLFFPTIDPSRQPAHRRSKNGGLSNACVAGINVFMPVQQSKTWRAGPGPAVRLKRPLFTGKKKAGLRRPFPSPEGGRYQ